MRRVWAWALIAGIMLLIAATLLRTQTPSDARFGAVLLIGPIPIVLGSSQEIAFASVLMALFVMIASVMLFWPNNRGDSHSPPEGSRERSEIDLEGGGVVMIGPIPVVFGSSPKIAAVMMIMAAAIMILWLVAVPGRAG